jgi:hypothetical protein
MKKEYIIPSTLVVPILLEGYPLCASPKDLVPLVESSELEELGWN